MKISEQLVFSTKCIHQPRGNFIVRCWDVLQRDMSHVNMNFGRVHSKCIVQERWAAILVANGDVINYSKKKSANKMWDN